MEQASQVSVMASALLIWAAMSRSCCHSSCAMPGGSRASRTCSCIICKPGLQNKAARLVYTCHGLEIEAATETQYTMPALADRKGYACREFMWALHARLQRRSMVCMPCVFLQDKTIACAGNGRMLGIREWSGCVFCEKAAWLCVLPMTVQAAGRQQAQHARAVRDPVAAGSTICCPSSQCGS